ncbi:uncharacterized protein LOC117306752 [Asterias rubens]|uniref:uncharacterized protein LOC117306752 n=1 Tax=Asterias rubens TaxID=7604 RepID=UPI001455747E|nr:uncharacterized protein LOC117306752 [Asterias rubens]
MSSLEWESNTLLSYPMEMNTSQGNWAIVHFLCLLRDFQKQSPSNDGKEWHSWSGFWDCAADRVPAGDRLPHERCPVRSMTQAYSWRSQGWNRICSEDSSVHSHSQMVKARPSYYGSECRRISGMNYDNLMSLKKEISSDPLTMCGDEDGFTRINTTAVFG